MRANKSNFEEYNKAYNELMTGKYVKWNEFPQNEPPKDGWYLCSVIYNKEDCAGYVMDLYWHSGTKSFRDNRVQNVFDFYEVHNSSIFSENKERVYTNDLCNRTAQVVAWTEMPKLYIPDCFKKQERQ